MLEIKDYSVSVDGKRLIDRQSVCIRSGALTGLVAPNGSGKTTFMRSLIGASGIHSIRGIVIDGNDDLADCVLFIKDGVFVRDSGASTGTEVEYKQLFG